MRSRRAGGAVRRVDLLAAGQRVYASHMSEVVELPTSHSPFLSQPAMVADLLERLATLDARKARIVELRVFGGLTRNEIATVMKLARSTVDDDWTVARAWLASEMRDSES